MGPTAVAGKVQIAQSVAAALSCPLYQGDSLHESSAKAATVGSTSGHPRKTRYQRMWLSKMTRTGLLFPEESRPATEGKAGFGGGSSTTTSRRGSGSSVASASSMSLAGATPSVMSAGGSSGVGRGESPARSSVLSSEMPGSGGSNTVFTLSDEEERLRRANPALMVLTHPWLERRQKVAVRTAVGNYGLGVIFVALYEEPEDEDEEEELPVLKPLDPRTMLSFPMSSGKGFAGKEVKRTGTLGEEMKLVINVNADVEGKTAEIIQGVKDIMGVEG